MNPQASLASFACLVLTLITIGYVIACAASPWGRCRKCRGSGRGPRGGRLVRGWCRRCNGTGLRIRVGRRMWTWVNREYREGQR